VETISARLTLILRKAGPAEESNRCENPKNHCRNPKTRGEPLAYWHAELQPSASLQAGRTKLENSAKDDRKPGVGNRIRLLTCCATAAFVIANPTQALAGEQAASESQQPQQEVANDVDSQSSGEIVVTATRRSEALSKVPLSVSAISGDGLVRTGIVDVSNLSQRVAGVTLSNGYNGSTNISVRGIASRVGAATTGIYLDETPIQSRFVGAGQAFTNAYPVFFDIERVEVLRGPQGTLFGAGSMGGTIRFITGRPSLTQYSLNARTEVATTDGGAPSYEAGVAGSAPIVQDKLGIHLAAYYRRDGGWVDRTAYSNGTLTEKNANGQDGYLLRASLLWAPLEGLKITPAITWQKSHRFDDGGYSRSNSSPKSGVFNQIMPLHQPLKDRFTIPSVVAEYSGDGFTVVNSVSFMDRKSEINSDYTGTVSELLGQDFNRALAIGAIVPADFYNTQKSFAEEFRIQSDSTPDDKLKWVVGVFYQNNKQTTAQYVNTTSLNQITTEIFGAPYLAIFGIPVIQPGNIVYQGLDATRDRQIAGFGQVDIKPTSSLTLTAGLRVAHFNFDYTNAQDGPFNGGPSGSSGKTSITKATPRFAMQWTPSKDVMFYGSVAQGVRQGGSNSPVPAGLCGADLASLGLTQAPGQYKPDTVWSYEVGVKGKSSDGLFEFDGNLFHSNWKDIQDIVMLSRCGFSYVGNLGSAITRGFDLNVTARPARDLSVMMGVSYTDAKFTNNVAGPGSSLIIRDGNPLPVAPWRLSLSLDYRPTASDQSGPTPYANINYTYSNRYTDGKGPGTIGYDRFAEQRDPVNSFNARLGMTIGNLDASVFVNNILNDHPVVGTIHGTLASSWFRDYTVRPRTAGATLSYKY
jgi:outer membrane receptor protein involved in Fe transport